MQIYEKNIFIIRKTFLTLTLLLCNLGYGDMQTIEYFMQYGNSFAFTCMD
jgi:hypothetical protein